MIPVYQTIYKPPRGNCYSACLASILEIELKWVPNYTGPSWYDDYKKWLEPRNIGIDGFGTEEQGIWHPGYIIAGVKSPSGNWLHAVVFKGNKFVHDPNPEYSCTWHLEDVESFHMVYPIDPSKPMDIHSRIVDFSRMHIK